MREKTIVGLMLVLLAVPFAGAIDSDDTRQAGPIHTDPGYNMTDINITNHTVPSRFGISPTPISVKVEISDTSLPGPKGEMAAGPRTIGFTTDMVSIAILGIIIIAGAAGLWYLVKRKPDDEGDE
jgi:hypothetical protein